MTKVSAIQVLLTQRALARVQERVCVAEDHALGGLWLGAE